MVCERLGSRPFSRARPPSERGLLGTVGMVGVLGLSGKGRKIRAERGEGAELRRNPEGLRRPRLQSLLVSLASLPTAVCFSSSLVTSNFYAPLRLSAVPTCLCPCTWQNLCLNFLVRLRAHSGLIKAGISRRNFKSRLKYVSGNLNPMFRICF